MSTATDNELPPPPTKPRLNPLDFRNTDLVSRLLAATPPYLYNMPMVPNSYFFSEMLRSFVQAKSEATSSTNTSSTMMRSNLGYQRRARKRPWSHQNHSRVGLEYFDNSKTTSWNQNHRRSSEVPLELTSPKIGDSGSIKAVCGGTEDSTPPEKSQNDQQATNHIVNNFNMPTQSQDTSSLLLPPPPPLWYPPMYPPPYGIDPLHFFIDLRVSGHIYDRKNAKDSANTVEQNDAQLVDVVGTPNNSEQNKDFFRQSRHASAFSVPVSASVAKNVPMNLSNVKNEADTKLKFDVKSMVYNKNGTSYVMRNINSIYKEMANQKNNNISENTIIDDNATDINVDDDTNEESGAKRAKHLKALFGLEMVVDYMKKKPASTVINVNSDSSGTTSDNDSVGSPALDVVDVNDDSSCM